MLKDLKPEQAYYYSRFKQLVKENNITFYSHLFQYKNM